MKREAFYEMRKQVFECNSGRLFECIKHFSYSVYGAFKILFFR